MCKSWHLMSTVQNKSNSRIPSLDILPSSLWWRVLCRPRQWPIQPLWKLNRPSMQGWIKLVFLHTSTCNSSFTMATIDDYFYVSSSLFFLYRCAIWISVDVFTYCILSLPAIWANILSVTILNELHPAYASALASIFIGTWLLTTRSPPIFQPLLNSKWSP